MQFKTQIEICDICIVDIYSFKRDNMLILFNRPLSFQKEIFFSSKINAFICLIEM